MTSLTSINLAWLDANVYSEDNRQLLERLRSIFTECREFTEEDECKRFLGRGLNDPRRYILIVSGQLGENLVPDLQSRENILSIYVYCGWKEKHEAWSSGYTKVKVITVPDELVSKVQADKNTFPN